MTGHVFKAEVLFNMKLMQTRNRNTRQITLTSKGSECLSPIKGLGHEVVIITHMCRCGVSLSQHNPMRHWTKQKNHPLMPGQEWCYPRMLHIQISGGFFIVHLSSSVSVSERSRSVTSYFLNLSICVITSGNVHLEVWWWRHQTLFIMHPIRTVYSPVTLLVGVSTQCVMSKVNSFSKWEWLCPLQNVMSQMDRFENRVALQLS